MLFIARIIVSLMQCSESYASTLRFLTYNMKRNKHYKRDYNNQRRSSESLAQV